MMSAFGYMFTLMVLMGSIRGTTLLASAARSALLSSTFTTTGTVMTAMISMVFFHWRRFMTPMTSCISGVQTIIQGVAHTMHHIAIRVSHLFVVLSFAVLARSLTVSPTRFLSSRRLCRFLRRHLG